jgi:hypothetical protein
MLLGTITYKSVNEGYRSSARIMVKKKVFVDNSVMGRKIFRYSRIRSG